MKLLLAALVLSLAGCPPSKPGPVLVPGDAPCVNACKILEHFGCPEAGPSPGGKTCVQVCELASKYGTQAECVVASESVASLRACGVECRGQ